MPCATEPVPPRSSPAYHLPSLIPPPKLDATARALTILRWEYPPPPGAMGWACRRLPPLALLRHVAGWRSVLAVVMGIQQLALRGVDQSPFVVANGAWESDPGCSYVCIDCRSAQVGAAQGVRDDQHKFHAADDSEAALMSTGSDADCATCRATRKPLSPGIFTSARSKGVPSSR